MTVTEFIKSQIAVWGEDYVDSLIDGNYVPTLTSAGWRWIYVADSDYSTHIAEIIGVDTAA